MTPAINILIIINCQLTCALIGYLLGGSKPFGLNPLKVLILLPLLTLFPGAAAMLVIALLYWLFDRKA